MKWIDIRKRLYKVSIIFVLSSGILVILYYLKNPSEIYFDRILSSSIPFSIVFTFSDLPFLKKK